MKINFTKKIKEKIDNFNNEKIFISIDFLDIADYETVRKTLNRLTNSEKIQKIIKGIYYNPKYNEQIEEYEAPSVHEGAKVIAIKYNWTIAPSWKYRVKFIRTLDTDTFQMDIYISWKICKFFHFIDCIIYCNL